MHVLCLCMKYMNEKRVVHYSSVYGNPVHDYFSLIKYLLINYESLFWCFYQWSWSFNWHLTFILLYYFFFTWFYQNLRKIDEKFHYYNYLFYLFIFNLIIKWNFIYSFFKLNWSLKSIINCYFHRPFDWKIVKTRLDIFQKFITTYRLYL